MGFIRKALIIGTGGVAPVKANSAKERAAKAAEKQVRLQQQALRAARAPTARPQPSVSSTSALDSPGRMGRAARRAAREGTGSPETPGGGDIAGELARLADLHKQGALTDEEFAAAKAKIVDS